MRSEPFKISTKVFNDDRGSFSPLETLNKDFEDFNIIQVNTVDTKYPFIFRGLHWQEPPYAQSKLIRCTHGRIIDFAVDIRGGSPTFGQTHSFFLFDKNDWAFIPRGFAHGYITLPHDDDLPTSVEYLVDNVYDKNSERGLYLTKAVYDTIYQNISANEEIKANERDMNWPDLLNIKTEFLYDPDEQ